MAILKQVKEFFDQEWEKASPGVHKNFEGHFPTVLKYAKQLTKQRNADKELVEISVWLHDISSIRGEYENHHIKGAKIAEDLLTTLNYPKEKIEQVKHSILNHRGSFPGKIETKEAQILVDADAMAHFDKIKPLFNAYKTKEKVLKKLERSYNKLSKDAKLLVKNKLEKARIDLK